MATVLKIIVLRLNLSKQIHLTISKCVLIAESWVLWTNRMFGHHRKDFSRICMVSSKSVQQKCMTLNVLLFFSSQCKWRMEGYSPAIQNGVRSTCSASERAPTVIGHHISDRERLSIHHPPLPTSPFVSLGPVVANSDQSLPHFPISTPTSSSAPPRLSSPLLPSSTSVLPLLPPSLLLFLIKVGPRQ